MKVSEIRAMGLAEAEKQLAQLKAELAKEKAVAAGGTRPENPGRIRSLRRNIARLLTVVAEKKRKGETKEGKEKKEAVEKKPAKREAGGKRKKTKAKAKKVARKKALRKKKKVKKKKARPKKAGKKAVNLEVKKA